VLLDWYDSPTRYSRQAQRYSQFQFQRAKAHYLARIPALRDRGVVISGAGPTGKRFAKLLGEEGIRVHHFVEVHPRRIGNYIHGILVMDENGVGTASSHSPVQIAAVGQLGRREKVFEFLKSKGFRAGEDLFCVT